MFDDRAAEQVGSGGSAGAAGGAVEHHVAAGAVALLKLWVPRRSSAVAPAIVVETFDLVA